MPGQGQILRHLTRYRLLARPFAFRGNAAKSRLAAMGERATPPPDLLLLLLERGRAAYRERPAERRRSA
jgi:hypothetical protein